MSGIKIIEGAKSYLPTHNTLSPETAVGARDFRYLIENSTVIVDKSLLIKEFLSYKGETVLITYPRRWGKTINLDMIKTFLELEVDANGVELLDKQNLDIFAAGKWVEDKKVPLNIWYEQDTVDKYFGKYPVISVSFKDVRGSSYEEIEKAVITQVNSLFSSYQYLLPYIKSGKSNLTEAEQADLLKCFTKSVDVDAVKNSIKNLSKVLYHYFNKHVFILIDEYDTPINDANLSFKNQSDITKTVKLFRGILGGALKGNKYMEQALVTGIMRIAKADLFSGVNNFGEYGILTEEFSKHYGFTQLEVEELLQGYNVSDDLARDIKAWYNGYNFSGTEIYNPWSILKCLTALQYRILNSKKSHEQIKADILQSYWEESGNVDFLCDLLKVPQIKAKISDLIEGNPVYFNLKRQITLRDFNVLRILTRMGATVEIKQPAIDLLLSYLFLSGYITFTNDGEEFRLPNNEIRKEFGSKLLEYYEELYNVDPGLFRNATKSLQAVLSNKSETQISHLMDKFIIAVQELMQQFPEFEKMTESSLIEQKGNRSKIHAGEDIIHSMFTYIILQVRTASVLASEMYLGKGRADLVLIDNVNQKCAIIELKYNKTADEAIEQIKTQEYAIKLQEEFQTFLIGINILPDRNVEVKWL